MEHEQGYRRISDVQGIEDRTLFYNEDVDAK
jgi:hypothetical protein